MNQLAERSSVIDIARGLAIILVVYGHCVRGLEGAGIVGETSVWMATDHIIYTFHMPLFFALSGLFFTRSADKGASRFWIGRLQTIVYPYFLWSLLQGGVQVLLAESGAVNTSMDPQELVAILWDPIPPFWFLYALLVCNIVFFLARGAPATLMLVLCAAAFLASRGAEPQILDDIGYGLVFFSLGLFIRERRWIRGMPASWSWTLAALLVFAAALMAGVLLSLSERMQVPAALAGIAAILLLSAAMDKTGWLLAPLNAFLELAGKCSMSIFVMHILVLGFVRTVLLRLFGIEDPAILIPAATLAAVLIPMAVQIVAVRLNVSRWAGLPASAALGRPREPAA